MEGVHNVFWGIPFRNTDYGAKDVILEPDENLRSFITKRDEYLNDIKLTWERMAKYHSLLEDRCCDTAAKPIHVLIKPK